MSLTHDQILQMAPDEASKKAGQQLANSAKWVEKYSHEKALWGDCQGSGSKPYKTIIDLQNLAFKCSCPSRKFPCKHGLGLLLLFASQEIAFSKQEALAEHVADWISKRDAKAENKDQKKEDKPIDEKAQQKRIEAREKKVDAGIEELRIWLKDVVRTGIMQVPQNPYQFNHNITTRMVDAQAGGLAAQLRKMNQINFFEEGWQIQLSRQLASVYFLTEAYQNKSHLDEMWQKELNTLIGWPTSKETVLEQTPVTDHWLIASKTYQEEANITTEKIWLYGYDHQQFALLLNFYAGNQLPQHIYNTGNTLHADLCFYPGVRPIRAIIKQQHALQPGFAELPGVSSLQTGLEQIADQLATQPFVVNIPFILSEMKIIFDKGSWYLQDQDQFIFSLSNSEEHCWDILAISKGTSFSCFVLYEYKQLHIHSVWLHQNFYFIQ